MAEFQGPTGIVTAGGALADTLRMNAEYTEILPPAEKPAPAPKAAAQNKKEGE